MPKLLRHRNCKAYLSRQAPISFTLRCVAVLTVCILGLTSGPQTLAQSNPGKVGASSLCNRNEAVEMIGQQIAITRTFDSPIRRTAVLIRAADLLWPFQLVKARAAFSEALEVASQYEKEKSEQSKNGRALLMESPDQRYVVIRAVAKRDPVWAKKLTEQMLKLDRGEQGSIKELSNNLLTAQRLLESATQLLATDINTAVDLAAFSLRYPASHWLTRFLYMLAEVNQQRADQFYDQALVVYADRPMREFLYLQAYPFAFPESGSTPVFGFYRVPANFVLNNSLQRRFVQTLLRRAQQALEVPLDEGDNFPNADGNPMPGTVHILEALTRIEPQVRGLLPDLSGAVVQARDKILVSLSVEIQKTFLEPGREVFTPPEKTFEEQIEAAAQTPNVNNRDDLIASAVLSSASDKETLTNVVEAIDKITDSSIRTALQEWLYFRRAKDEVKNKRFDEAETLVSKVEGLEQRAHLQTEIAKGLLNGETETQTRVRELLEAAISGANKAGNTIFAARALLASSVLYAKIDPSRSISVLRDAINRINKIENPDFSAADQTLVKAIARKSNPGRFIIRFPMPGPDPENVFREMAKIDFDGALSQTNALTDKFQRAVTTLALADVCLQTQPKPKKPNKVAKP